jgi:3-phosphoshikimate 1-carboxyvinyltransferase
LCANGLNQLGVLVRRTPNALVIHGTGGRLFAPKFPIPVGNAGTTLRFLLSLAALAGGTTVLEGGSRMAERPNDGLVEALRALGVVVRHREGTSRFEVDGGTLRGGRVDVRSAQSSQFLSSILLVAPYAQEGMEVTATGGLASASYAGLTLDVMRHFGVVVRQSAGVTFAVSGGARYQPCEFRVEADASSASYAFGAAAIAGGEVVVPGMSEESRQGDAGFAPLLRAMGCTVETTGTGMRVERSGSLRGVSVDMNAMPDLVPTLAAVALFADSPTHIRNVAHLRYKESDRVEGLAEELRRLGADVVADDDTIEIRPAPLHGALLDSRDDHRLAMSFALIGLRVPGVKIENPDCVGKSFPGFWSEFERMIRSTG